ncbi:MAG TPA: hypothetical protein VF794_18890 [Archangium sp.]|uniref:hypothetical protein n=1 Tax=Archangium sp. TaxID=1872627 RepID=UPI002EDA8114
MKSLVLPTLLALAATGCMHSRERLANPAEEAGKCELVQTLMRQPLPQAYLAQLAAGGRDEPAQVLVYVRRPEQSLLERLFEGEETTCGGLGYNVVQQSTTRALVVFLQPTGNGYTFDVQRAAPDELSLGGEPKGVVTKSDGGGWAASSL